MELENLPYYVLLSKVQEPLDGTIEINQKNITTLFASGISYYR